MKCWIGEPRALPRTSLRRVSLLGGRRVCGDVQAVAFEPAVEGPAAEAQRAGRDTLVPASVLQRTKQMRTLDLSKRRRCLRGPSMNGAWNGGSGRWSCDSR